MAIPTVSAIGPVSGHTGGRTLVEIDGTNFAINAPGPPVNGYTPTPVQSVAVTFGGIPALTVRVLSTTELYVTTPISDPGAVDVVVQNLDANGNPIPGESVTVTAGYSFVLPTLTSEAASDLQRVIRTFILELRRQVTPHTDWPAHTDYDDTTGDELSITKLPQFPGLVIAAVDMPDNDFYALRGKPIVQVDSNDYIELAPPTTIDIVFTLVGLSDNSQELINLHAALRRFFRKNPYLTMARDPNNLGAGTVQYELRWERAEGAKFKISSNKDNVRHFAGTATIVGFDIESMAGIPLGGPGVASEAVVDAGQTVETINLEPTTKLAIE